MESRLGLLAGSVNFENAAADEFNDWLDTEHIPERLCIAGVINAVRWLGVDNPKDSLVLYDLESLAVLQTAEYLAVSFENFSPWSKRLLGSKKTRRITRFACEQINPGNRVAPEDAGGLLVDAMNVAPEFEAAFNLWCDTEHIPEISEVPGVLCARRFQSGGGTDHKYVTLYHLESPEVCDSVAWKRAAAVPTVKQVQEHISDRLFMRMRPYVRREAI